MRNGHHAAKPDGLVLLALPNVHSLKGLITKYTPHAFHISIYCFIYRSKNAGYRGALAALKVISPGTCDGANTDIIMVLRKPAE